MGSLIIFIPLIAVMYFMLIRPQQQRMKAQSAMMSSLRAGDDVILSSGIYGTVTEIDDDIVWVEVAADLELKVVKSAIESVLRDDDDDDEVSTDLDTAEVED